MLIRHPCRSRHQKAISLSLMGPGWQEQSFGSGFYLQAVLKGMGLSGMGQILCNLQKSSCCFAATLKRKRRKTQYKTFLYPLITVFGPDSQPASVGAFPLNYLSFDSHLYFTLAVLFHQHLKTVLHAQRRFTVIAKRKTCQGKKRSK